jgi:FkbM family methyltransferase
MYSNTANDDANIRHNLTYMKERLRKFIEKLGLKFLLFWYRKIRLVIFSYLKLPKEVKVLDNGNLIAVFNTRDFATANVCQYYLNDDVLDYEPEQKKVFIELAKQSKVIFDIGTQIVFYAILGAKLGAEKVIAIDVDEEFLEIAKKQAKLNKVENKIEFIQIAIGEDDNIVEVENFNAVSRVKSISLDSLCKNLNLWPDFIKIDIEGFELEAFKNAKEFLKRKPKIILALHPEFIRKRNKNPSEVLEILLENNYKIQSLDFLKGEEITQNNLDKFLNSSNIDFICI